MRFGAAYWVQRTGWPELREAVLRAEAAGFDDLWIDDHLLSDEGAWLDAKLEGWSTLAAIAAITTRPRLGLMVAANTFRNPGLTAKLATTLDHISGGSGDPRHRRGLVRARARGLRDRLRLRVRRAAGPAGRGRPADPAPARRRARHARGPLLPVRRRGLRAARPSRPHLPILIGGSGPKKTLPMIARHGDLWNAYGTVDGAGGVRRDPARGVRGRRAGRARDRADGERERRHPRQPRGGRAGLGRWVTRHAPTGGRGAPHGRGDGRTRSRPRSRATGTPASRTRCSSSGRPSTSRRWIGSRSCVRALGS